MNLRTVALTLADECIAQKKGITGFTAAVRAFSRAAMLSAYVKLPDSDAVTEIARVLGAELIDPDVLDMWCARLRSNMDESTINNLTRLFVTDYHPFDKDNRMIAWVLQVWLLNQWDDPQPFPEL